MQTYWKGSKKMALALVKLEKRRGNQVYYVLDYISAEVAKLGVEINGEDHSPGEFAKAEIVRIYD